MGGKNPYTDQVALDLPKTRYSVRFEPMGKVVEVDPSDLPLGRDGQPGSILDIGLANDIDIDHACGGVTACSTCHVIFREGGQSCSEATDDEEDMLDLAPGLEPTSRLACQAVPDGSVEVVVEIPDWNRNHAKEAPH
ncbi:MAG: 2Fe-2S ferredoxin [Planctomycetota bacterium]|jgi:2Fe-2S ferredoxin